MEARLAHPIFAALQPWLGRLDAFPGPSLGRLNELALERGLRAESGRPVRFVPPDAGERRYGGYELRIFECGEVQTRNESAHDVFNALCWLAFPRTKARLNALHARAIPGEPGRRLPFRDLLTLLDEGGAIVSCDDAELIELLRGMRWKALFWEQRERVLRSMRLHVLGHAALEQALSPWPGITCKALLVPAHGDPDTSAADWLDALPSDARAREIPPLPIFGYPGWLPGSANESFYDDARYFRITPR